MSFPSRVQKPSPRNSGARGLTFVEVMIAFLIMGILLLPVYVTLTNSVKDIERFYTEAVAISHAKFIMDTIMFQLPFRVLHQNDGKNFCRFEDPKNVSAINGLLGQLMPKMFATDFDDSPPSNRYFGKGLMTDRKGFMYRIRVQCFDLEDVQFFNPKDPAEFFKSKDLTTIDADGRFTLIKKIIVEVRWSNLKGKDPVTDPLAKSLHLVGFKSFLEG